MFFLFRMENKKFIGAKQPTWQAFERERKEDSRHVRRAKGERGVWRPHSLPLPFQTLETNLLIKLLRLRDRREGYKWWLDLLCFQEVYVSFSFLHVALCIPPKTAISSIDALHLVLKVLRFSEHQDRTRWSMAGNRTAQHSIRQVLLGLTKPAKST